MYRLLPAAFAALALLLIGTPATASEVHLVNQKWVCSGPVDIDLVQVERNDGQPIDAVSLNTGCTGRIGRIEVLVTNGADGIKVQNSSPNAAHDLVVESAEVIVLDHAVGVHQDGMQIMGGANILFKNLTCYAPKSALGCFAVSQAGGFVTDPTNIICENCLLGPNKGLRIGHSVSSGARNTSTCGLSITPAAVNPVTDNVTVYPSDDPGCQGAPPPPPDTTPPPVPTIDSGPPVYPPNVTFNVATFAFSDSEAGVTFKCSLDGGTFAACSSPVSYANYGVHTFAVTASDAAGNESAAASRQWKRCAPGPC